jgi:hypothetical protein
LYLLWRHCMARNKAPNVPTEQNVTEVEAEVGEVYNIRVICKVCLEEESKKQFGSSLVTSLKQGLT